jgi:hypothetical protein
MATEWLGFNWLKLSRCRIERNFFPSAIQDCHQWLDPTLYFPLSHLKLLRNKATHYIWCIAAWFIPVWKSRNFRVSIVVPELQNLYRYISCCRTAETAVEWASQISKLGFTCRRLSSADPAVFDSSPWGGELRFDHDGFLLGGEGLVIYMGGV